MPTISIDELKSLILNVKGARPASLVLMTVPKMNKKVNGEPNLFYGRVKRGSYRSVMLGFNYENSVNYQRKREGKDTDFVAQPPGWGDYVDGSPLVEKDGEFYLAFKSQREISSTYFLDGELVDDEVVEPYLAPDSSSSRQGVDRPVLMRKVLLQNIKNLVMDGETYEVCREEVLV